MYKHILIPTDGSPLSQKAIEEAVSLAKALGAKVTGVNVVAEFGAAEAHLGFLRAYREGWTMPGTPPDQASQFPASAEEHLEQARGIAEYRLSAVESAAGDQGVECNCVYKIHDEPYEAIIETAKEQGCDLIAMASHGWRGARGLVLGSETNKVITHSSVPVLVLRYTR
ncbi:MAG: universal stress protein [Gammaproteobacteria bacterium]